MRRLLAGLIIALVLGGWVAQHGNRGFPAPVLVGTWIYTDGSGSSVNSLTTTSTLNVPAGSLVMGVCRSNGGGSATTTSVTDTAGNTFVQIDHRDSGNADLSFWYAQNAVANAADKVTCNYASASGFNTVAAGVYTGASLGQPIDVSATGTGTGNVGTTVGINTVTPNEVLIAAFQQTTAPETYTAGSGYTIRTAGAQITSVEDKTVNALQVGAVGAMSWINSAGWSGVVVSIKGGPALPPPGCAINSVSLSGNNTFTSGVSNTPIGTVSATRTGSCPVDAFTIGGADAASFQLVGTTLETNGSLSAATYHITLIDTIRNATGSPFSQAETLTGASSPGCTITAVNITGAGFDSSTSNAPVGVVSSTTTGSCPSDSFSISGTDAAHFMLVGTTLEANGTPGAGTYHINLVDTLSGATGSPFTQPETITGATCQAGSTIAAPASIILPPAVPGVSLSGDIVGLNLQNNSNGALTPKVVTFGQVFKDGDLATTDGLRARIGATNFAAQMDPLNLYPSGKVRLAAVSITAGNLCPNQQVGAVLQKVSPSGSPVAIPGITLTVGIVCTSGCTSQTINLGTALATYLAGSPTYWLRGPQASQTRVDVPWTTSPNYMHSTLDITANSDGYLIADVQFNGDLTAMTACAPGCTIASQAPANYTATITFNGHTVTETVSHYQYEDWHVVIGSDGTLLTVPQVNVQHDVGYLEHTGAIPSYDRTTGVANTGGFSIDQFYAGGNGYPGVFPYEPLSFRIVGGLTVSNNVNHSLTATGNRPDLGPAAWWNAAWMMTQDYRAMITGLSDSDAGGTIPWNFKLANGHWLNQIDFPNVWVDIPSYRHAVSVLYAVDEANAGGGNFTLDNSHMPDLSYIPWIMSARRWNLDRLNAQAAYSLTSMSDGSRGSVGAVPCPTGDCLVNFAEPTRTQAWASRTIGTAAQTGHTGDFETTNYLNVMSHTWAHVQTAQTGNGGPHYPASCCDISPLTQGTNPHGWVPEYGSGTAAFTQSSPWTNDYFITATGLNATLGDTGAQQMIGYLADHYLAGRFNQPNSLGMNPYDGVAYRLIMTDGSTNYLTDWPAIEAATVAQGFSNGTGWSGVNACTNGYNFCRTAYGAIGAALTLNPTDTNLINARAFLTSGAGAGNGTDAASFQIDPVFNIVPIQP